MDNILGFKRDIFDLIRNINEKVNIVFQTEYELYNLTTIQVRILIEIHINNYQTVGDLGKMLAMSSGNISSMCKKLELEGFVKRIRDKDDERVVKVELSEKGLEIMNKLEACLQQKYSPVIQNEPDENLEDIIKGFKKLDMLLSKLIEANNHKLSKN